MEQCWGPPGDGAVPGARPRPRVLLGPGPVRGSCWGQAPSAGPGPGLEMEQSGAWPRPLGPGPDPWGLAPTLGAWPRPLGPGPDPWGLAPALGAWPRSWWGDASRLPL